MNTMPVYAFFDADGVRHYVDSDDFVFTGTWSSSGTFMASPYQATQYGSMLYMCITDNIGRNPASVPTRYRPARYWSPMVIVVSATGTTPEQAAYGLAADAYALAQIGTNLGSLAYTLAEQAQAQLSIGLSGTYSVWVAPSSGASATLEMTVINGLVTSLV